MALAAKGVSVDPVTGNHRISYKEYLASGNPRDEEAEDRSPILATQQTYTNPYEAPYGFLWYFAFP